MILTFTVPYSHSNPDTYVQTIILMRTPIHTHIHTHKYKHTPIHTHAFSCSLVLVLTCAYSHTQACGHTHALLFTCTHSYSLILPYTVRLTNALLIVCTNHTLILTHSYSCTNPYTRLFKHTPLYSFVLILTYLHSHCQASTIILTYTLSFTYTH